jgi:hypothetical protein
MQLSKPPNGSHASTLPAEEVPRVTQYRRFLAYCS